MTMKYTDQKHGRAEYGSYVQVSQAYWDGLAQEPLSGLELKEQYFSRMVHVTNAAEIGGGGGGGGTIADGVDNLILATVADLTNSNPLASMIVDANGDQITTFGGGSSSIADGVTDTTLATVADLTNSNPLASMIVDANGDQIVSFGATLIAETGTPIAVADGAPVDAWFDEFGRQVIAGYNPSLASLDVNLINDSTTSRLGPVTNLNAVVADTDGAQLDISNYHNITVHFVSASTTSGATVNVESSLDGVNWSTVASELVAIDTVTEITMGNVAYRYVRTTITGYVDGTFTAIIYAGN
jgi:hypothetical protein